MKTDSHLELVNFYGLPHQLHHFASEVDELLEIVREAHNYTMFTGKPNTHYKEMIASEIADCYNFIEQIRKKFEIESELVVKIMKEKNERQLERKSRGVEK